MRVVYVSTLHRGGPVTQVRAVSPALAALGVDLHVVSASAAVVAELRAQGIPATCLPFGRRLALRSAAAAWPVLARADVVHTADRRSGLLVRPQARLRGAVSVHTVHGLPEALAPGLAPAGVSRPAPPGPALDRLRVRAEAALARLGQTVVHSRALAAYLIGRGFPPERVHLVPAATPNEGPPTRRPPGLGPLVVGTAANLEHHKGIDVLLDACAGLVPAVRLIVYGEGSLRPELEQRAARLGLDATFPGFVDDLRVRLRALDVFVLPSRGEQFPHAVLEAMAVGLPVVATRVGGIPEQVLDRESGLLVEPEDVAGLRDAVERLAGDPAERTRLGDAAAVRAAALYSPERIAAQLAALYEDVCASST